MHFTYQHVSRNHVVSVSIFLFRIFMLMFILQSLPSHHAKLVPLTIVHTGNILGNLQSINANGSLCTSLFFSTDSTDPTYGDLPPLEQIQSNRSCFGGIAAVKAYVDAIRAARPKADVLYLDAGNLLGNSQLYSVFQGAATTQIMQYVRPDVMALGPADWFDGQRKVAGFVEDVPFAVLSTDFPQQLSSSSSSSFSSKHIQKFVVLTLPRSKIKVVVLGLTGLSSSSASDQSSINTTSHFNTTASHIYNAQYYSSLLSDQVDALRTQQQVHFFILLSNMGLQWDKEIARLTQNKFNLIISNDENILLLSKNFSQDQSSPDGKQPDGVYPLVINSPNSLRKTYIVSSYKWGFYANAIDFQIDLANDNQVYLDQASTMLLRLPTTSPSSLCTFYHQASPISRTSMLYADGIQNQSWSGVHHQLLDTKDFDIQITQSLASPTQEGLSCAVVTQDQYVLDLIHQYLERIRIMADFPLGVTKVKLDASSCNIQECSLGTFLANVVYTNLTTTQLENSVTTTDILQTIPDIVLLPSYIFRSSIYPQDITLRNVIHAIPHHYTVATLKLRGFHLIDVLENAVSALDSSRDHRFLQVAGLRFTFNPRRPPGSRIVTIEVRNHSTGTYDVLKASSLYTVLTEKLVRRGALGYSTFLYHAIDPYDYGPPLLSFLLNYVKSVPIISKIPWFGNSVTVSDSLEKVAVQSCSQGHFIQRNMGFLSDDCGDEPRDIVWSLAPDQATKVISLGFMVNRPLLLGTEVLTIFKGNTREVVNYSVPSIDFVSQKAIFTGTWLPQNISIFATSIRIQWTTLDFGMGPELALSFDSQTECPGGFVLSADAVIETCIPCNPGFFRSHFSDNKCVPCKKGSTSGAGRSSCTLCDVGSIAELDGMATCRLCPIGSFANETGSFACNQCSPGTYAIKDGSYICEECTQGSYQDQWGQHFCIPCPAGSVSGNAASTCSLCYPGHFAPAAGLSTCTKCPPGFFSSSQGSETCTECGIFEYANSSGLTSCFRCPQNSRTCFVNQEKYQCISSPESISQCHCDINYFGNPGMGTECILCPEGAYCCECPENESYCDSCLLGSAIPRARKGYYELLDSFDPLVKFESTETKYNVSFRFLNCRPSSACLGNNNCAPGYTGVRCGQCQQNADDGSSYYWISNECLKCSTSIPIWVKVILVALPLVLVIAYLLYSSANSFQSGSFSIAFDALQTIAIYGAYDLDWPKQFRAVLNGASSSNFNLDLLAPDCYIPTSFYSKWIVSLLLPIFMLFILAFFYAIYYAICCYMPRVDKAEKMKVMHVFINAYLGFLSMTHAYLAMNSLSIFRCDKMTNNSYFLQDSPSMYCYDESWYKMLPIAIVSFLLYGLGIPLLFSIILWRHRDRLDNGETLLKFRSLYEIYSKDCFYWEILMKFRKLCLILSLVFFKNIITQTAAALLIFQFSLIINQWRKPYWFMYNNFLHTISSLGVSLFLFSGLMFKLADLDDDGETFWIVFILCSMSVVSIILIHGIIYEWLASSAYSFAKNRAWVRRILETKIMDWVFSARRCVSQSKELYLEKEKREAEAVNLYRADSNGSSSLGTDSDDDCGHVE